MRAKPWATPLGKALQVSGKIVGAVDGFVPGAKYLGGALSFGATLLYPEPTVGEIKVEFAEVRADMKRIFSEVGESSRKMTEEMSKMRDLINQTFQIVVDCRFKVS